jgi:hypothetical protein
MSDRVSPSVETNLISISVRLPIQQIVWLKGEGDKVGSVNQVVRDILNDRMNSYQLPEDVVETIKADREQRGLDARQYVVHLFMDRYKRIIKGEISVPAKDTKKSKKDK